MVTAQPKPQQSPTVPLQPKFRKGRVEGSEVEENLPKLDEAERYRSLARELGHDRSKLYEESQTAWQEGDKHKAKLLSDKAKAIRVKMETFNEKASQLHFEARNQNRGLNEVDLHGQFVQEAIELTEKRIQKVVNLNSSNKETKIENLVVIYGKGIHSEGGHAKIKPAIIELMKKYSFNVSLDDPNEGCMRILFNDQQQGDTQTKNTPSDSSSSIGDCHVQ